MVTLGRETFVIGPWFRPWCWYVKHSLDPGVFAADICQTGRKPFKIACLLNSGELKDRAFFGYLGFYVVCFFGTTNISITNTDCISPICNVFCLDLLLKISSFLCKNKQLRWEWENGIFSKTFLLKVSILCSTSHHIVCFQQQNQRISRLRLPSFFIIAQGDYVFLRD